MTFSAMNIDKWNDFFSKEDINVTQVIPISQDFVRVVYKDKKPYVKENPVSNSIVAVNVSSFGSFNICRIYLGLYDS